MVDILKQIRDYHNCHIELSDLFQKMPTSRSLDSFSAAVIELCGRHNNYIKILPIDHGFEHGPDRSFSKNIDAYDPLYHIFLAYRHKFIYAAPIGAIKIYNVYIEKELEKLKNMKLLPMILKLNSSNSLMPKGSPPYQAITASVEDAVRLGCIGVGFTIYPGSSESHRMFAEFASIRAEANKNGLLTVVWAYPRGESMSKEDETSLDTICYAAHIASLLGADIVKVKMPDKRVSDPNIKFLDEKGEPLDCSIMANRVKIVTRACMRGRVPVVFSGGAYKDDDTLLKEVRAIKSGGGFGSIIGRNIFQRKDDDINALMKKIDNVVCYTREEPSFIYPDKQSSSGQ